jgi:hypothetical protein
MPKNDIIPVFKKIAKRKLVKITEINYHNNDPGIFFIPYIFPRKATFGGIFKGINLKILRKNLFSPGKQCMYEKIDPPISL